MTLRVALVIDGTNAGAKQAVDGTSAAVRELDAATHGAANAGRELAAVSQREQAATNAATAATRSNTSAMEANAAASRKASAQRANLIFQLNDIFVSLASGMNPAMVAIQQGSQISTIYGPGGLGKALSETGKIAASMATRFAPIALGIGAVAISVAALTTEINRGQKTQVSFFDVVQAGWELAAARITEVFAPVVDWLGGIWDWVAPKLADGLINIIRNFDLAFKDVKTIWSMLPSAVGDFAIKAANNTLDALAKLLNNSKLQLIAFLLEVNRYAGSFTGGVAGIAAAALAGSGEFKFAPMDNPFAGSEDKFNGQMAQNRYDVMTTDYGGMIGDKAREIANRPDDKKAKAAKTSDYAREIASIRERTAAMQVENNVIGLSTFAAERLRKTFELETAARKDTIGLTAERIAEIQREATAYAQMAATIEQTKLLYDAGKEAFNGFFSDLKSGLLEGQSAWEALGNAAANALDRIADRALSMAADGIWDLIFGAITGGLTGGLTPQPVTRIGFGSYGSFDTGGWTGGSRGRPAGVVHGEEFVVRAGPAAANRVALEALNAGGSIGGGGVVFSPTNNFTLTGGAADIPAYERLLDARDAALVSQFEDRIAAYVSHPMRRTA